MRYGLLLFVLSGCPLQLVQLADATTDVIQDMINKISTD